VNPVTFGDVGLADIRPSHIEAWVKVMQDAGFQPTTIRARFANVRNVFFARRFATGSCPVRWLRLHAPGDSRGASGAVDR
jgi:hypothetical protein